MVMSRMKRGERNKEEKNVNLVHWIELRLKIISSFLSFILSLHFQFFFPLSIISEHEMEWIMVLTYKRCP